MLIKYGETNVTDRLLDYKMSVSFADCRMIGNVPSIELTMKFDNYDGILDNIDISKYWEVKENDASDTRYFKVYDQPEKYTKELTLKMYDNNYSLDKAYDTKLSYPVTIKDQLDEIESLTGWGQYKFSASQIEKISKKELKNIRKNTSLKHENRGVKNGRK